MILGLFLLLTTAISIVVGLQFAANHKKVLDKVTNYFNRILAFVIGAATVSWCALFLLTTWAWLETPPRYREFEVLLLNWAGLIVTLIAGILFVGLLTTLADIRENARRLAQNGIQAPPKEEERKWTGGPTAEIEEEVSHDFPAEPDFTDEQKANLAKELVRNAELAAMPVGVDEESPTDP